MTSFRATMVLGVFAMMCIGFGRPSRADFLSTTLIEDTYVSYRDGEETDVNYSSATDLWVRSSSFPAYRLVLAQFELPPLPAGWTPSSIFQVRLSGTVTRCTIDDQELEVVVLKENPDLTKVTYDDVAYYNSNVPEYDVIAGIENHLFIYGDDAELVAPWTGFHTSTPYVAEYVDSNAEDGLLYWVQQTISPSEPTTLTLGFGPLSPNTDFFFRSKQGVTGSQIPLTLTLIPEPSSAMLCLVALAGGMLLLPRRRRRKEST